MLNNLLDDNEYLIILSIGPNGNETTRIQKIALILSKLLGIELDTEAYHFGGYSETIQESLQSKFNINYFFKKGDKYYLTEEGKKIHEKLIEKLRQEGKEDIVNLLTALEKVNTKNLVAMTYFLFPEMAKKSVISKEVKSRINKLMSQNKKYFEIKKSGNEITIEEL